MTEFVSKLNIAATTQIAYLLEEGSGVAVFTSSTKVWMDDRLGQAREAHKGFQALLEHTAGELQTEGLLRIAAHRPHFEKYRADDTIRKANTRQQGHSISGKSTSVRPRSYSGGCGCTLSFCQEDHQQSQCHSMDSYEIATSPPAGKDTSSPGAFGIGRSHAASASLSTMASTNTWYASSNNLAALDGASSCGPASPYNAESPAGFALAGRCSEDSGDCEFS
ncbi:unnamed protein product, partial [Amoebophrya sp. A25]|eukprot:GSA25T00015765001.1